MQACKTTFTAAQIYSLIFLPLLASVIIAAIVLKVGISVGLRAAFGASEDPVPQARAVWPKPNGREPPHGAFEGTPGSVYTLRTSTQGSGGFEARNFHLVRSTVASRRRRGHGYTHDDIPLRLHSMLKLNWR